LLKQDLSIVTDQLQPPWSSVGNSYEIKMDQLSFKIG